MRVSPVTGGGGEEQRVGLFPTECHLVLRANCTRLILEVTKVPSMGELGAGVTTQEVDGMER